MDHWADWVTCSLNCKDAEKGRQLVSNLYSVLFFFVLCQFVDLFGRAARRVGSYSPYQGSNLRPLHWKLGVLTTGPPGKSLQPLL